MANFSNHMINTSIRLAECAKNRGYEVPESDEIKKLFGQDGEIYTDVAEQLLLRNGFKRDKNGKWLLPDGSVESTIIGGPNPSHGNYKILYQPPNNEILE